MAKKVTEPDRLEAGTELEPDPGDVEQMDTAFDEATAPKDKGKTKPPEKAAPPLPDGDDDDKEEADPHPDGEDEEEGDGKPPPPPDSDSPEARLADLEKRYQDGDGKPADPPPPPPPPPPPLPAEKPASGSLEEQVQSVLTNLGDELEFGGNKVNAKSFKEDFGEESTFMCAVVVKATAPLVKEITRLREDLSEVGYWSTLESAHPGARRLADDPKFKDWLSRQPEAIKRASVGSDPSDAIVIVDAYKATLKDGAVRTAKESQATAKAKRDTLHLGTLRGNAAAKAGGATADNKEDFDAAFDEATKKD